MDPARGRRVAALLIGVDAALVLVYLADAMVAPLPGGLRPLFHLDGEGTIPAWFTSAQLLLAGAAFWWRAGQPAAAGLSRRFLALVGLALLFLSLDETASVHERLTFALRPVEAFPRFTGDHGLWIPIYLGAGVGFLSVTGSSWRRLWARQRVAALLLALGAVLLAAGAIGLEIVGYEFVRPSGGRSLYVLQVALEEGLELLGASALVLGSLHVAVPPPAATTG